MEIQLTGKTALVTGSTAGIGFAIASLFAQEGSEVVVNGRSQKRVAVATTYTERTLQTFYNGLGGRWRRRGFGGMGEATTTEQDYKEGTLVVDMYDAKTKQADPAWQRRRHGVQQGREE